jgi:predicted permease
MEQIISQMLNLLPLFVIILFGYLFGATLKIKNYENLSKIILFIFWPIVAFNAISTMELSAQMLLLPIIFFFTTTIIALASKRFAEKSTKWDKKLVRTFSYSAGSGNVIFVGLPALMIILGEKYVPILLICVVGYIIYDSSVGYLIMSGEKLDWEKMVQKLIRFPPIIGIMLGLLFLLFGIDLSDNEAYRFVVDNSQITMATLGLFLVGLAVSNITKKINITYLSWISMIKSLVNPLLLLLIIMIDKFLFNFFGGFESVILLIASVPVAANSVVLATNYTGKQQTAALGVLVTAILSLVTIPLWQLIGSLFF